MQTINHTLTVGKEKIELTYMGKIPEMYCSVIYTPCTLLQDNVTLNASQATPGTVCATYFTIPDILGTLPISDYMFLCGYQMYEYLPGGWVGRCAAVIPADHSYIVSTINQSKTKRDLSPHDSLWGSDVPDDHKIWTMGEKILLSLFPSVGVGKLLLRVETLSYRFTSFINDTLSVIEAQREELHALRAVALQNRIVLDEITASLGGVCTIVGESCCTYIPANDEDGGAIQQGIANLTKLRNLMEAETVTSQSFSGLGWFLSSWRGIMVNIAMIGGIILILFSCFIPCIFKMVRKMVSSQFVSLQVPMKKLSTPESDQSEDESVDMDDSDGDSIILCVSEMEAKFRPN